MALKNPWVGYLDRSYLQIKNSILKRLGQSNPEITDHSESNILVVIVSLFAGVSEMLNYYIDNMAREAFITTARRYSSVVKHTRLIDYRIKAALPASVNMQVIFLGESNEQIKILTPITIPQGTVFQTNAGVQFLSIYDVTAEVGDDVINIPVEQKEYVFNNIIGETSGANNSIYEIGTNYVHNSMLLKVGGEIWDMVDTLGRSGPDDKHYVIEITAERKAIIKFGDNINGKVPGPGLELLASYYNTLGQAGNVDANTINQITFTFDLETIGARSFRVNNINAATGGTDYESIERIRRSAPLHLRTLDRAVTRQDYIDIAMLAPGVDKATIHFNCGKFVEVYISPNGGGIAATPLLISTKDYIDRRKMVTTFIDVKPAGESQIVIDVEVWARFRMDAIQTREDILQALFENYNYDSSSVNRKIRKSDIIALIDNLEKVDYLKLKSIYIKPYFRNNIGTNELIANIEITNKSIEKVNWLLQFDGNFMRIYRDNNFEGSITLGLPFSDPGGLINITIQPNNYVLGDEWRFTTYAFNEDIEVDDFTVPIINLNLSTVKVNKQILI